MALQQFLTRLSESARSLPLTLFRRGSQAASYEQVKTEDDYELESSEDERTRPQQRYRAAPGTAPSWLSSRARRILFATLGVFAVMFAAAHYLFPGQGREVQHAGGSDHRLYLLIPSANEPDIGFCRTELTAGILGFPTPKILNRLTAGRSEEESERDKIRITNDQLNDMGEDRDEDVVILLDAAHHWFQLRPEVLMKRYYNIISKADARVKEQTGDAKPPTHQIVFATQNHCSGHTLDELACFAPPDNPVDKTSTQRYLNAGLAVGPVKDMRRLFNRVNGRAIARLGDDMTQQTLLAQIFGEQEFRREFVRQGSWSSRSKKMESVLKALGYSKPSITEAKPGRQLLEHPEKAEYESGITIDYGNELGLAVSRRADLDSIDWVRHNSSSRKNASTLPKDIMRSRPPFWTTTSAQELPIEKSWSDVPLLTSKRSGGVPAIINVAVEQQSNSRAGLDWRTLWLHSHAKTLWEAQNEISRLPLMSVVEGITEHTFWNQELRMDRDGANWLDGGWKPFSDHCSWGKHGELILKPAEKS